MGIQTAADVVFECTLCGGPLVAGASEINSPVTCAHCLGSILVPGGLEVTDDTLAPGVRRVNPAADCPEPALPEIEAELAAMTRAHADVCAQLEALRAEFDQARREELQMTAEVDLRIADLQRHLDRVLRQLAAKAP